jgi:nucleoside-diphosphate-sugar epimerase
MRIVVTGGSGKAGRWVVANLRAAGHDVLNVDLVRDGTSEHGKSIAADLTDAGQCHDVIAGRDVVVHLAAIPAPGLRPETETFRNNAVSTYNVFAAAVAHRVGRVVWASSETILGLPFEEQPPLYVPVDEAHPPRPDSSYALSKLCGEVMADQLSRRSGIPFVGLRFSNIMEPADYARFPTFWADPHLRSWNAWGYVDARDVAESVRLAIEAETHGADVAIVAAADTVMNRPSVDLMAEVFPEIPIRGTVSGRQTLLSIDHARELLGYTGSHSWQDEIAER